MAIQDRNRKQEIQRAARTEFVKKGVDGTRLQSITEQVGVTKAMIHYYFDTKENLFMEVYREACRDLFGEITEILERETPLLQKLEVFISRAIDLFHDKRDLLPFVINELNSNPDKTVEIFSRHAGFDETVLKKQLEEAASNYEIAPVTAGQLLTNILSLCMFPYVGKEFTSRFLKMESSREFDLLLEERKDIVADTIINWITS